MKTVRFWFGLLLCFWFGIFSILLINPSPLWAQLTTPWQITRAETASFEEMVQGMTRSEGLFTVYQSSGKLYLEIKPDQLNQNYLCITSLASGLGEDPFVNGFPLSSFLFRLRRVDNKIQFVLPNVNYRVSENAPLERSIEQSFSDSVLQVFPIKATHPTRQTLLLDFGEFLLSENDVSGLSDALSPYYKIDLEKSSLKRGKIFPQNIEIKVVYGFSVGNRGVLYIPSVPDSRSFNLTVHYSFSQLPQDGQYIPRLADDRVGYFVNSYKDIGDTQSKDPVVRYIERWRLLPMDSLAPLSPPQKPIVFWLENTIPMEYRDVIREGALLWNKAFEQAGFKDAIVVKQMPDDATWDPADVRYNTIRWSSTSNSGILGLGPSHVNPLTGEILDADIVLNGNVVRYVQDQYENLSGLPQGGGDNLFTVDWCQQGLGLKQYWGSNLMEVETPSQPRLKVLEDLMTDYDLCYGFAALEQVNMGMLAMTLLDNPIPREQERIQYIEQFLRWLVVHEVGHALGLRHNFHGSTLLQPEDLNNTAITHQQGLVSSVMDYVGVNLAPLNTPQGDFFPVVVGPYDCWAIEYGYKFSGELVPVAEQQFLEAIASQSTRPELSYATDEDSVGFQDPYVNTFDLSGDVLKYAQWQMDNARQMWKKLEQRYPVAGDRYSDMRVKFNQIFGYYARQASFVLNFVGGRSFNRDRPGTPNSRLPFEQVPLEKQRKALDLLQDYIFAADGFNFSPQLLNQLAPSRWGDVGQSAPMFGLDYPIHDNILRLQRGILRSLLSDERLSSLRDQELKAPDQALTLPELYDTLTQGIWSEVWQAKRGAINISSLRRSLQREHLKRLGDMVLGRLSMPEDAKTLAWYQLRQLEEPISSVLRRFGGDMDTYTKAHLEETRDRITRILEANFDRAALSQKNLSQSN